MVAKKTSVFGQQTEMIQDVEDTKSSELIFQNYEGKRQADLDSQERGEVAAIVYKIIENLDPNGVNPYTILCIPSAVNETDPDPELPFLQLSNMCQATPAVWLYDEARPAEGSEIQIRFDNIKDKNNATYIGPTGGLGSLYDSIDLSGLVLTGLGETADSVFGAIGDFAKNLFGSEDEKIPNLVLNLANRGPKGGTYELSERAGNGVPFEIVHEGITIAKQTPFVYCSGYTFSIAFRAAQELGLLEGKTVKQIRSFKFRWYGAKGDRLRQQGPAMEYLGIGSQIPMSQAKPGDFCQLWRNLRTNNGHSVIFKGWLKDDKGQKIGIKYISAQGGSGIADNTEKFRGKGGGVLPEHLYFSRLKGKNT